MTTKELHHLKEYAEFILGYSIRLLKERDSIIRTGLYSETKLKDEKQLALINPQDYYSFRFENVYIYPYYQKNRETYTICCENWQPKAQYQKEEYRVYRGKCSFGEKETLEEALITFDMLVNEFLKQHFDKYGALF